MSVDNEVSPSKASKILEALCEVFQTIQCLEAPDRLLVAQGQIDYVREHQELSSEVPPSEIL